MVGMTTADVLKDKRYSAGAFPRRIEIELSSVCNLKCVYCPRRYLGKLNGFIELTLFKRLIDEIAFFPETILVLHRRGESLLHPDFIEICNYIKGKFKQVQLATNATLLDQDKSLAIIEAINFISFSIDIPEVFNKTRIPAQYDKVVKNIEDFLRLNRGRVKTQVSMVKTPATPDENSELFKKIWLGKIDRVRIYEEHSRDGRFGSLSVERGRRRTCMMPFYEILIYCSGKTGRCNHDWNGTPIGDVKLNTIKEIWNDELYHRLRRQQITLMIEDEVCRNCDSWYAEIGNQGTGEIVENG
jgi:radical SAM protein with 4Fe4S-binding SPASM domain